MKRLTLILALCLLYCFNTYAQAQDTSSSLVWRVSLFKVKPGMIDDVLLDWRQNFRAINEELKRQGVIVDYRVYVNPSTDGPDDWDIGTAIAYKNWAALDSLGEKVEAVTLKHYGSREKRQQATEKLNQMRQLVSSHYIVEQRLSPIE